MSEIFKNSTHFVYLDIYGGTADGQPTAICSSHDDHESELVVQGPETVGDAERWTAIVGLEHTQDVGELDVLWTFSINGTPAQKTDRLEVVVPLVDMGDIRDELFLPESTTDKDVAQAERRVRRIIERVTGQSFMPTHETLILRGRGDNVIRLPKRLISVDSFKETRTGFDLVGYDIRADGWELLRTLQYDYGDVLHVNGPIYNPFNFGTYRWPEKTEWAVSGRWGWDRVPPSVQEATLILIEDRLCPEATYRDRYLTSMKAADWRFDISPAAFGGTGNVIADQLLAPYRVVNMAVI